MTDLDPVIAVDLPCTLADLVAADPDSERLGMVAFQIASCEADECASDHLVTLEPVEAAALIGWLETHERDRGTIALVAVSLLRLRRAVAQHPAQLPSITDAFVCEDDCPRCHGTGLVCENHEDRQWPDVCSCGAGMPCSPSLRSH